MCIYSDRQRQASPSPSEVTSRIVAANCLFAIWSQWCAYFPSIFVSSLLVSRSVRLFISPSCAKRGTTTYSFDSSMSHAFACIFSPSAQTTSEAVYGCFIQFGPIVEGMMRYLTGARKAHFLLSLTLSRFVRLHILQLISFPVFCIYHTLPQLS